MLSHEELGWSSIDTYRCLPCVFRSSEDVSLELQVVVDAHGGGVVAAKPRAGEAGSNFLVPRSST